jgi:creatinine amidohydrolase
MTEIRWHKLRRDQIADAAAHDAVLLLPIGSVEQHGPHLPIDTDTNAATAVAERAAARATEPPALVLPPIWWGLSPYWLPFPGTLSLRPETILALISDLGASVARHGFRRMIVLNGHGGNAGIVGVAATALADHGIRAAGLTYWDLLPAEVREWSAHDAGSIGHAGEVETSIQLYLQPDLVAPTLPEPTLCADVAAMTRAPFAGAAYAPPDPAREAPHGIYGYAPGGRRELGEQVIEMAAERLAAYIRHFAATDTEPTTA